MMDPTLENVPEPQPKPKSAKARSTRGVSFKDEDWRVIIERARADGKRPSTWVREAALFVARSGKRLVHTETLKLVDRDK